MLGLCGKGRREVKIQQVYFNTHKKCFSIREKGGRVVDHQSFWVMENCWFVVSQAGRSRVLREGRKNVHAWVEGYPVDIKGVGAGLPFTPEQITYNPYTHTHFKNSVNEPVERADLVTLLICDGKPHVLAAGARTKGEVDETLRKNCESNRSAVAR